MEVFKIKQAGVETQNKVDNVNTIETTQEAEAKSSAKEVGGTENDKGAAGAQGKEILITIDGPVGRVFTDALNKLLVAESYMMQQQLVQYREGKKDSETEEAEEKPDVQVFCFNGPEVTMSDVVMISDEVTRNTDQEYIVALEGCSTVTRSMALLDSLTTNKNLKVCFTREQALSTVKGRIVK